MDENGVPEEPYCSYLDQGKDACDEGKDGIKGCGFAFQES